MSDLEKREAPTSPGPARATRLILILSILVATVASDQITKEIARRNLPGKGTVEVVGSVFIMAYVENQGAFLGLGSDWSPTLRSIVFGLLSGVIVVAAIVYLISRHRMPRLETTAFSLIAGGGIGNMIDRITRGGMVSDFLNIGVGRVRTGVFNLADLYLMAGIFIFLIATLVSEKRHGKNPA